MAYWHDKNLMSTTNRVEVPYIKVTIGTYTFGCCTKQTAYIKTADGWYQQAGIKYPNFIQSLNITKINGQVNEYTLSISYPIRPGDDPNFFEKVFSSVSSTRKIIFTYGDMSAPEYVYRNEQAIIVDVTSDISVETAKINYTVKAISSSTLGYSGNHMFPYYASKKPSDLIKQILADPQYGLNKLFYGMNPWSKVESLGLIESDDKEVELEAKNNISAMDYLNYLVSSMIPTGVKEDQTKLKSFYILTIHDEAENETLKGVAMRTLGGPYIKVTKVSKNINRPDAYNLIIGYPTANIITSFRIQNQEAYSIYFDWQSSLNTTDYIERINDDGEIEQVYSPRISSKNSSSYTRAIDKTWWSKVTQYPISATLTVKGLLRPALLMQYIRIDTIFHGQKHNSSGLYIITKQQDSIGMNGYKTTLSLTRVDGADMEIS